MAQISIRFKAATIDLDTTTKEIMGLHVEYDLTTAQGTIGRVWDGVPDPETADSLWGALRRFLRPMAGAAGVSPPDRPLPGS